MSKEWMGAPDATKERAAEHVEHTRHEVYDTEGRLRCTLRSTWEQEPVLDGQGESRKRLTELLIDSANGQKKVNILEAIGCSSEVIYLGEHENKYDPETKEIHASEQETLIDLYILLHECGHAAQSQDERFQPLMEAHMTQEPFQAKQQMIRWLKKQEPDAIPEATFQALETLAERHEQLQREKEEAWWKSMAADKTYHEELKKVIGMKLPVILKEEVESAYWEMRKKDDESASSALLRSCLDEALEAPERRGKYEGVVSGLSEIKEQYDATAKQAQGLTEQLHKVDEEYAHAAAPFIGRQKEQGIMFATRMVERDATSRALHWIREIERELGEKLTFSIPMDAEQLLKKTTHVEEERVDQEFKERIRKEVADGGVNPVSVLNILLETYDARHPLLYGKNQRMDVSRGPSS